MRLRGLIRKEFFQILRDPCSLAIAFLLPLVLLLLFGYGVSLDAKHMPIALVVDRPTRRRPPSPPASSLALLRPGLLGSIQEAEQALAQRQVNAILWLR